MSRTDRPGFWRRLFGGDDTAPPPPAEAAPLFRPRPVPPPPPRGPGLPDLDDILTSAPPVPVPGAAPMPRLRLVPDPAPPPPPSVPPLSEAERDARARIAALLSAGDPTAAQALLDATFGARPEALDDRGRPIYLLGSLRCALRLGDSERAAEHARLLRPHLAGDDPVIEVLHARAAGHRAAARAHWLAALARAPDLAEAREWLAAHPGSPEGGVLIADLFGPADAALVERTQPPPPLLPEPADKPDLPDWLPARLLTDAAVSVDDDGTACAQAVAEAEAAGVVPRAVIAAAPDDLALLFRHPDGLAGQHAFAEVLLAAFVIQRQMLGHLRPARLYVGRQPWALPPAPEADGNAMPPPQAEMLAALFPGLRLIAEHDGALREASLLVVDGAWRDPATGTLIGGMMPWARQWAAEARARAHAACGLPDTSEPPRLPGRTPRLLYLHAAPPHALLDPVRDRLFGPLIAAGFEIAMADIASLRWQRQVRLAYGADLIAGPHGPAQDVVLWAHPETRVLEFFPRGTHRYDGQLLAEAAALPYLGLEGVAEYGFAIAAGDRRGKPTGEIDQPVADLPWAVLGQMLAQAGADTPG